MKQLVFRTQMLWVLATEIKWHEDRPGTSEKGEQWESGFIAGLKQAAEVLAKLPEAEQ